MKTYLGLLRDARNRCTKDLYRKEHRKRKLLEKGKKKRFFVARSSFPMGRARDLTPYVYPLIFPLWFGKGPWDRLPHRCWPENSSLTGSGYSARSEGIKSGFGDFIEMTPFWARGFLLNTVKHTSVFPPRPWRLLFYFLSP